MSTIPTVSHAIQAALKGAPGGLTLTELERIGWKHGNPRIVGVVLNDLLSAGLVVRRDGWHQWFTWGEREPGSGRIGEPDLRECYRRGARILMELAGDAPAKRRPLIRLRAKP